MLILYNTSFNIFRLTVPFISIKNLKKMKLGIKNNRISITRVTATCFNLPLIRIRNICIFDKVFIVNNDSDFLQLNYKDNNFFSGSICHLIEWGNTYNSYFVNKKVFYDSLELKEILQSFGFELIPNKFFFYNHNHPDFVLIQTYINFPAYIFYEKDEFGMIDYDREKTQLLGGFDSLPLYYQLIRERPEFRNIFIYHFFVGSKEPKTLDMKIFFDSLKEIYDFLILTIKIKFMHLVHDPSVIGSQTAFNEIIIKLSTFLILNNFINKKNELSFKESLILYNIWIIFTLTSCVKELLAYFSDFLAPLEPILSRIFPKFLFSFYFKSIYKVIPFVFLLYMKINLDITWAGFIILGYFILRIINLIALFLLYIIKAIKFKTPYNKLDPFLLNVLYIPVKVIKTLMLLILLWWLFKNQMELFFILPIVYQNINYLFLKLQIWVKDFYYDSFIGWLNYNLDPHRPGRWESFKTRISFSYRDYNDELRQTIRYEKKLIKSFSWLPLPLGKFLLGEKFKK